MLDALSASDMGSSGERGISIFSSNTVPLDPGEKSTEVRDRKSRGSDPSKQGDKRKSQCEGVEKEIFFVKEWLDLRLQTYSHGQATVPTRQAQQILFEYLPSELQHRK